MSQLETKTPTEAPPVPLMQITAERAIALFRWWLRLGVAFNVLMIAAVLATSVVGYRQGLGSTPAFAAAAVWLGVLIFSARSRQLVFDAAPLIAAGEFGLAEDRLSQSLRSFSVLRSTKLLGLQQLALLRHAQARWADAAKLSRELLDRQRGTDRGLDVPSRLMLAESLVELDDIGAAGIEVGRLSTQRMGLRETLMLTQLQLELQARTGRFADMMRHPHATLGLVELMPPVNGARCHALLALAARKLGRDEWRAFLAKRATLLIDADNIVASRPFLRDALDLIDPTTAG